MNWRWVKPLESEDLIKEYEENIGYTFPNEYKEVVKNYNGARPEFKEFKSKQGRRKKARVFEFLFSFNKYDKWSIWGLNNWKGDMRDWNIDSKIENMVGFAGDPFGNLICFDKTNGHIVFVDHETLNIEPVADSFTEFINSLRKS